MSDISRFNVTYDRRADVAYISTRKAPAARGIEDPFGVVWRYDSNGDLIGVTIVDYYDQWMRRRTDLARDIADKFDIPTGVAERMLEHVRD